MNVKKIGSLVILLISFFGMVFYVNKANAEACGNRDIIGNDDIFWGNPPPRDPFIPSPRQYNDVTTGGGTFVRLSVEGEFSEAAAPGGQDCTGQVAVFEIYNDGSIAPIRTISGSLNSGSQVAIGNFGTWQWYIAWPHDLFDGRYRFRLISLGGAPLSSMVSLNVLIVTGAGPPPPPSPPTCNTFFSPNTINAGQPTVLNWTSSFDADGVLQYSCSGSIGSGNTIANSSSTVNPVGSQTCTFTVINSVGSNSCSASVTVVPLPPPPPPPPSCNSNPICSGTCTAPPNSCGVNNGALSNCIYTAFSGGGSCVQAPAPNQPCTLNNCTPGFTCSGGNCIPPPPPPPPNCNINPACSGTCVASPNTCSANNGTQSNCIYLAFSGGGNCNQVSAPNQPCTLSNCSSGFTCNGGICFPPPPPPPPPSAPTANITCEGQPGSCTINYNSSARINWNCTDSRSGTVINDFDGSAWNGTNGLQQIFNVLVTRNFFLTCTGPGGSANAKVVIDVNPPPLPPPPLLPPGPPPGPVVLSTDFTFRIPNPFSGEVETIDDLFGATTLFLYYIAGPIVVMMIILAGLFFLFGRGQADKINTGKKILLYAVIGLAIILIGSGFIQLIESILALGRPGGP